MSTGGGSRKAGGRPGLPPVWPYVSWALLAVAYVLSIAIVAYSVSRRQSPSPPVAVVDLSRNHQLAASDLQTDATKDLIGSFLKRDVRSGEPVTPDLVATAPLAAPVDSTMAAIVTIAATERRSRDIAAGDRVGICLAGRLVARGGQVVSVDCDEKWCAVTVAITDVPAEIVSSKALVGAWLTKGAGNCAGP